MARSPGFRSAPHGAVRSPSATAEPRVLPVGIYPLLTQDGWSLKMQRIYEDLKSNDIPNTTLSILLQNPRKWKGRNGKGQILTEALYADESGKFEGNVLNNIQKYRNIISQKENSLHKYYTSTLTNDALLARYFKFPNNPKQGSTKTLKEEQEEFFNRYPRV